MLRWFALLALLISSVPASAKQLSGDEILLRARNAAGGDDWANARTLHLSGQAVFYGQKGAEPTSRQDSYEMWRVFDPDRQAAHGAEGKVRITIKNEGKLFMDVGYDGATT